jgi:thiol-disulfide isomerase/thioredoxin
MRLAAVLVTAVLVLTGCAGSEEDPFPLPGQPSVEVDSTQLRELKADAGVEPCRPGTGDPVDGGLPEVELACFGGGKAVDLSSLRGPMVINLWAVSCGPCRREMPILQAFHEQYGDRVPVLGIDWQDMQAQAAMSLVIETGVTYPLVADPAAELSEIDGMPVAGLPALALLDEDGRVAFRQLGEIKSEQELVDLVEEHLGVRL